MNLQPLIAPRSVAIVGASGNEAGWGNRCLRNIVRFGFQGNLAAVNRSADPVNGVPGFANLRDIPWPIEQVGIAVPAAFVADVVRDCNDLGVPAITVYTSGFGELGTVEGKALEADLARLRGPQNGLLLGPNCNGIINVRSRFAATVTRALEDDALFAEQRVKSSGTAIVAQSGGLAVVNILWRSFKAGLGVDWVVSTGNQVQLHLETIVGAAVNDESIVAVLMVLEALPREPEFRLVAEQALRSGKILSALKVGRTSVGARAAQSHTGSFAGSYDEFHDWCQQFGVICVEDPSELYETTMGARTAATFSLDGGIGIVSLSGGNATVFADIAAARGVNVSSLEADTVRRLKDLLPPMCHVTNPLDLTSGAGDPEAFGKVLEVFLEDENIDICVVVLTLNPPGLVDRVREIAIAHKKPLWIAWVGGALTNERSPSSLRADGIVVYETMDACVKALTSIAQRRVLPKRNATTRNQSGSGMSLVDKKALQVAFDKATIHDQDTKVSRVLGGSPALELLRGWNVAMAKSRVCDTKSDAVAAAREIGFPVVLKIDDAGVAHKTEVDGVRTGIRSERECEDAWDSLTRPAGGAVRNFPILVQQQVEGAVELFVAGTTQGDMGPMVSIGLGGVLVEVLRDIVRIFPPIDSKEIEVALGRLKGYPILNSFRAMAGVDMSLLAEWLENFAQRILTVDDAIVVDINPLLVPRGGAAPIVVDASIVWV